MESSTTGNGTGALDPGRWQRLKAILADALERETPAARTAALAHLCANDSDLLKEAEALLSEAETLLREPGDNMEECANEAKDEIPRDEVSQIGNRVGAYVLIREVGHGGMGTVFLAARADGYFEKQVAIKVLRGGASNSDIVRRFRSEREVLARLDHPNIARLIDAGSREDGSPYFVMDYVEGETITAFVQRKQLSLRARLHLFLKICAAVEAAHHNSIVHRDLKPSNILVNAEGEPKLLDFGIAKMMGSGVNALEATAFGKERLTPISASPEQARGEAITVASDVYALGVVLYEMLTGRRPHRFKTDDPSREELLEVVCQQRPTPPSLAVEGTKEQRSLRGSLDAILLRALEKDPAKRYQSVGEFAEEVRRYLEGKPVLARKGDWSYPIQRILGRPRVALPVAAVVLVAGAGFFLHARSRPAAVTTANPATPPAHALPATARPPDKSIAVLPFTNVGATGDTDYFVDGFQEDILTNLAKLSDLKVISRTSVMAYRGAIPNAREIGRALGVSFLLEGSVQKSGDQLRLNVRLVDTSTEREVWAEQYERRAGDLFALQNELSEAIIAQLRVRLSQNEKAAIEARPTEDILAYDFYLQAKESLLQDDYVRAVQLLDAVLLRDPNFSLAYCLAAKVHLYAYRFAGDTTPARLAKAKEAADTALRLAPDRPESHLALAQYYYYGIRDFEKTRQELKQLAGSPVDQAAFFDLVALTERRLGRWQDAIRDGQRAMELDPSNPFIAHELVESFIAVRRYDEAERIADKAVKANASKDPYLAALMSDIKMQKGQFEEARAALQDAKLAGGLGPFYLSRLARFQRDYAKARDDLSRTSPTDQQTYPYAFCQALVARASGDHEGAQKWFGTARGLAAAKMSERPMDPQVIMDLAVIDAGLGRKEDARRESEMLRNLAPLGRDAVDGPMFATVHAQIHAWIGDVDGALAELEQIVSLPSGPTQTELKFDPGWDEIRNDPRFSQVVSHAANPLVVP